MSAFDHACARAMSAMHCRFAAARSRTGSARKTLRWRDFALLLALSFSAAVYGGPVESYREGPQYCPRDRTSDATPLTEAQVDARALMLLPGFCGPSTFVDGCLAEPDLIRGQWRVYIRQYQLRDGERIFGGLDHTYVILDRVGNCLANIPGTPLGALH